MSIPAITDIQSLLWQQPRPDQILLDETHALMSRSTFEQLQEYSCSIPTGIYPGKMWKSSARYDEPRWRLCWYVHFGPGTCAIYSREILLV